MELYFLRHGIAEDNGPEGSGDAGRRLTKDGASKIKAEANGLRALGVKLDTILSSPLVRAHETAEIVARALRLKLQLADALAPGCDVDQLLRLLAEHRGSDRIMVVGHEPDFSQLVGALTGGSRVLLKKGGLARVDLDVLGQGEGALVWLLPPRLLR